MTDPAIPTAFDFGRLRDRIACGWWKLNDDGTKSVVGSAPHFDLYGAVLWLDGRFPVHAHGRTSGLHWLWHPRSL